MADPYQCLRCSSIAIGAWNLLYCLSQFGILGWQTQVVKERQWEYENRQLPPTHAIDGFQARFPGLYAIYTETPERRKINALYVIVLISVGLCLLHLLTTISMLFGVIKRQPQFICVWFFTAAPLIMLTTAYAILWWSGDIFNEQLTMSVTEFIMSCAINGPAFLVVLMYYLRITGTLRSEVPGTGKEVRPASIPRDVPPWYSPMPAHAPFEVKRKLRRRERSRERELRQQQALQQQQLSRRSRSAQGRTDRSRLGPQRPDPYAQQRYYRGHSAGPPAQSGFSSRRKSPQRVSFKNRPRVYERTPSSSFSSQPKLEIQTVV